ncbi:MAG: hypothetical protein Q4D38_13260, partial [Planctomycetia bacterium]|nr:hypothetical protein [Planctomycetia bacterium]
ELPAEAPAVETPAETPDVAAPEAAAAVAKFAHLGKGVAKDGKITMKDIDALPEKVTIGGAEYTKEELKKVFRVAYATIKGVKVEEVQDDAVEVSLKDYQRIQTNDWGKIYRLPLVMLAIGFVIFLLFGKNPTAYEDEAKA